MPHELNDPDNVRAHRSAIAAKRFITLQADAAFIGLLAAVVGGLSLGLIPGVIVAVPTVVGLFAVGYVLGLAVVSRIRKAKRSR